MEWLTVLINSSGGHLYSLSNSNTHAEVEIDETSTQSPKHLQSMRTIMYLK